MSDLIRREDAIHILACEMYAEAQAEGYEVGSIEDYIPEAKAWMSDAPSADAVQGYTEWLEKIIVEAEIVWICEDATDREWCKNNCHYSSIQAECLRHLYEVSKGGDSE